MDYILMYMQYTDKPCIDLYILYLLICLKIHDYYSVFRVVIISIKKRKY